MVFATWMKRVTAFQNYQQPAMLTRSICASRFISGRIAAEPGCKEFRQVALHPSTGGVLHTCSRHPGVRYFKRDARSAPNFTELGA
jgi:hypothetical protein